MKICGIYKITEKSSGKCYIGQSIDIARRFFEHQTSSIGWHQLIQKNPENWEYTIIETCTPDELNKREKYWITYYNSFNNGFNQTSGNENKIEFFDLKLPPSFYKSVKNCINFDLRFDIH